MVAAPFLNPNGALGMIVLSSNVSVRQFTEEDMALLVSLASVDAGERDLAPETSRSAAVAGGVGDGCWRRIW